MKYDWILDVLADLKSFAQSNGLDALAEQLDDTLLVAATEIASNAEGADDSGEPGKDSAQGGLDPGAVGKRASA